jgi:hypothetical protein
LLEEEEKGAGRMVLQQSVTISMTILIGRLRKIEDEKEREREREAVAYKVSIFEAKKFCFPFLFEPYLTLNFETNSNVILFI